MPTTIPWSIRYFLEEGFKRIGGKANQLDGLRVKKTNYNLCPPFKIQATAYESTTKDALRSSEAFAHNIFSGVKNVKFEHGLRLGRIYTDIIGCGESFDTIRTSDTTRTDVVLDDGNGVVDIYEVKMFEYFFKMSNRPIFPGFFKVPKEFYAESKKYKLDKLKLHNRNSTKVSESFKSFIEEVTEYFRYRKVYQEGIRQICCQLLGITNEMKKCDAEITKYDILHGKKIRWHCLCFDHNFGYEKHIISLNKWREALEQMSPMIKNYLKNVNLHRQIKYCGYLGASNFIEKNKDFLGKKNYNYVKKRYFFNIYNNVI